MAREYILSDITCRQGHLNNSYIYDLTFIDLELNLYMMIVDTTYRNYEKWSYRIETEQLGAYTGLRRTNTTNRENIPILDADFAGQWTVPMTARDIEDLIHYQQQRRIS